MVLAQVCSAHQQVFNMEAPGIRARAEYKAYLYCASLFSGGGSTRHRMQQRSQRNADDDYEHHRPEIVETTGYQELLISAFAHSRSEASVAVK